MKEKPIRRKVKADSDADSDAAQAAEKHREQSAVKDGTAKRKRRSKSRVIAELEQLGSEARNDEGIIKFLKATKKAKGLRDPTFDYKRVHIVSKSLCGKDTMRLCVFPVAYSS